MNSFSSAGTWRRITSTQSCEACTRANRSVSAGVWLTTLSSCLCDQTSVGSGATFRSPTTIMRFLALPRMAPEPRIHRLEEIELVAELLVERGIGKIAARRHVDVVQHDRACVSVERDGEMPRMAAPANVAALVKREGEAGENGDAVIALLAGYRDVREAQRAELELGKLALDAFDLLQAEQVRPVGPDEAAHQIELGV